MTCRGRTTRATAQPHLASPQRRIEMRDGHIVDDSVWAVS
jgi:hypothetical protein